MRDPAPAPGGGNHDHHHDYGPAGHDYDRWHGNHDHGCPTHDHDDGRTRSAGGYPDPGCHRPHRLMGFGFRKSKKLGPFRFTLSHRGVSASTGAGPVRVSRSSTGRRTKSVRIGKGLYWRKSRG